MKFLYHPNNFTIRSSDTEEDINYHHNVISECYGYYSKIHNYGLCKNLSKSESSLFYSHLESDRRKAAFKYCASCPVSKECLLYAIAFHEDYGVWGGTLEATRTVLFRKAARTTNCSYTSIWRESLWKELLRLVDDLFKSPKVGYTAKGKLLKSPRLNPLYKKTDESVS